jgi:hypothetical protein
MPIRDEKMGVRNFEGFRKFWINRHAFFAIMREDSYQRSSAASALRVHRIRPFDSTAACLPGECILTSIGIAEGFPVWNNKSSWP